MTKRSILLTLKYYDFRFSFDFFIINKRPVNILYEIREPSQFTNDVTFDHFSRPLPLNDVTFRQPPSPSLEEKCISFGNFFLWLN